MTWPVNFGTLTSPVAMSNLDVMFAYLAQFITTPCTASSGNAKTLTPIGSPSPPAIPGLVEGQMFEFLSPDTVTGNVTMRLIAGAFLQVYNPDGSAAGSGQIVANAVYLANYSAKLNAGAGGFQLIGPPPNYAPGFPAGVLKGANMNSTADQAIGILLPPSFTKYTVERIVVTNPSISLTTAVGGIYGATAKGPPILVAAAQTYSGLTTNTLNTIGSALALTVASPTADLNLATLYLSLTTPQGAAATADVYVYIQPVT